MANPEHVAKLREGVQAWNRWRQENPEIEVDLSGADLGEADLEGAHLGKACLSEADLTMAGLTDAWLTDANLSQAILSGAYLTNAVLTGANLAMADLSGAWLADAELRHSNLSEADLDGAVLNGADFDGASLTGANLCHADLSGAWLTDANLTRGRLSGACLRGTNFTRAHLGAAEFRSADLTRANLAMADLTGADLSNAILQQATLVGTNLEKANLTDCRIYGISAWDVRLEGAIQSNLVITPQNNGAAIQVDNLEVAQFVYLLLNNEKIRQVIDTITSKVVLILGRFTEERKAVLDAIREELRRRDYLPILFDFQKPDSKDLTGTVTTLANMARFVIADLTDPSCIPYELAAIVPGTMVPVQPIMLEGQREFAMFRDLQVRYHWVLDPCRYESKNLLIGQLANHVIAPAEAKAQQLRRNHPA